ncbi:MAG: protein kinase [Pyrinomonadaceae bacterium]|nr:protein kinase [Pyrinomonadaceae bacterium]
MKYCTICDSKYEDSVSFCPLDGEVLEDDPTSIVNSTLDGQYHIETMLGKGGMGAVYRARHILLGDRVAIKVLPPQMRNNAEWLRRFRREGQAARRFRHPNAVTVYDLRTTNEGMIYMVMEYVEGHTLDAELKTRGRFTPDAALDVLEPVMSVLNSAHAQGVVHRDLKPENIMIGKPSTGGEPVVKLLDLGIAKISELAGADSGGSTALTVAGQILGTPYYMSPEQWGEPSRDNSPEVDGRADIYSLGTVFYELVAGRRPFSGLTLQELRREHVTVVPKPLHEVAPDVPEGFSQAIARAMAKERDDRQTTAGELANELRTALGMSPVTLTATSVGASSPNIPSTPTPTNVDAPAASAAGTNVEGDSSFSTGIEEGRQTSSEISAATVLTLDSPPRPKPPSAPPPAATSLAQMPQLDPPPAPPNNPPPMATIATNPNAGGGFASSAQMPSPSYAPQPPPFSPSPAAPMHAPKGRSPVVPIIIVVVVLLFLAGIGGGVFIWMRSGSTETTDTGKTDNKNTGDNTNGSNNGDTPPAVAESMRYWLELEGVTPARVAAVVPLASKQSFKFHFTPKEDGYLYIVGPGKNNVPTTFLTAVPFEGSGVTTNSVKAGENYSFPSGGDNWITLDENPGTEFYTVIFSKTPITLLPFLNEEAGQALSSDEQDDLDNFLSPYKANAPATNVMDENKNEAYVSVKPPQAKSVDDPLVFDVRIEHK